MCIALVCAGVVAGGCGTARNAAPDPAFTTWPDRAVPRFEARGRIRVESGRGDIEGRLHVRVDPPHRAWLEIRADAVFGLVGERVVVSLPGDGWVLTYEERADRIERLRFEESWGMDLAPGGDVQRLLEVATGRLPWPAESPLPVPRVEGRRLRCDLAPAGAPGSLLVEPGTPLLRRLEWLRPGLPDLRVEYGPPRPAAAAWVPSRVAGRAGDIHIEVHLDAVEPRDSFADADFDIGGTPKPDGG